MTHQKKLFNIQHLNTVLIIFIVFLLSCNKARKNNPDIIVQEREDIIKKQRLNKSLTFLIDVIPSSVTQIIEFSDTTMKHGFAKFVWPSDTIESKDIVWKSSYEIDGISYPFVKRPLNQYEMETIERIILNLESNSYDDPYGWSDCDLIYSLYIDNQKITYVFDCSLGLEDFSPEFKSIIKEIISIGGPLYPNSYGI